MVSNVTILALIGRNRTVYRASIWSWLLGPTRAAFPNVPADTEHDEELSFFVTASIGIVKPHLVG